MSIQFAKTTNTYDTVAGSVSVPVNDTTPSFGTPFSSSHTLELLALKEDTINKDSTWPSSPASNHYPTTQAVQSYIATQLASYQPLLDYADITPIILPFSSGIAIASLTNTGFYVSSILEPGASISIQINGTTIWSFVNFNTIDQTIYSPSYFVTNANVTVSLNNYATPVGTLYKIGVTNA